MILYASLNTTQLENLLYTSNKMIPEQNMPIMILITCIFILLMVLAIVFFQVHATLVLLSINILAAVVSLIIYIICLNGKNMINEKTQEIQKNIDNLNSKKQLMIQAGLDITDANLMNAITDIEKIITILNANFPHDDTQSIFNLLIIYIKNLQSLDTNKIQHILNVLNSLDINSVQNILNQIQHYLSNGATLQQIQNILLFLQTNQSQLLLISQLLNGQYSNQLSLINNLLTNILSALSTTNMLMNNHNVNDIINMLNNVDFNILIQVNAMLTNLQNLNAIYQNATHDISLFIQNIANKAAQDIQNILTSNSIIDLISATSINAINSLGNIMNVSANINSLVNTLYVYKTINTLTNNNDTIMMQLFSMPMLSNQSTSTQNNQINTSYNTLNLLSTVTNIPQSQLPCLIATSPTI